MAFWRVLALVLLAASVTAVPVVNAADAWDCDDFPRHSQATPVATTAETEVSYPNGGGELTIFAAASLTEAFGEIEEILETAHDDLDLTVNVAGSQTLVTQIVEGAPADVLATAAWEPMQRAIDERVTEGKPREFARNELTIVVPAGNPGSVTQPADLARENVTVVLAAAEVPAGLYVRTVLCSMTGAEGFGDDFASRVAANLVSEENSVKAVLAKIALGEADAGIVYTSDVTTEVADDVETIAIPDEMNVVASYPIAAVRGGDPALARWFIGVVVSDEGQQILEHHGFRTVS